MSGLPLRVTAKCRFSRSTRADCRSYHDRHSHGSSREIAESRLRMGTSWIGGDIIPRDGSGGFAEVQKAEPGGVVVKPTSFLTFTSFPKDYRPGERLCRVALRRLGRYLLVDDNEQCGAYQTYRGIYGRFDSPTASDLSR